MSGVDDLVKDLDEKMGTLRTRQSRRDQFLTGGTEEIPESPSTETTSTPIVTTKISSGVHGGAGQDIYLGNLPAGITEAELKKYFQEFNPIRARVLSNDDNSWTYGFVKLPNMMQAKAATLAANKEVLNGNVLSVRICRDQSRARIIEEGITRGMAVSSTDRNMTLHIGNIATNATEEEVHGLFASFGGVANISLNTTRDGNRLYARVMLRNETLMQQAIKKLNGSMLHGINITAAVYKFASQRAANISNKSGVQKVHPGGVQKVHSGSANTGHTGGMQNGHHMAHGDGARSKYESLESLPTARRLIQKIEVLSSEVLDSCDFCMRLQSLIHELQVLLNRMH